MFAPTRKTLKEWVWNQRSCGRTSDSWNNEVGMLQAFSTAHIIISFAWVDICSLFKVETPMIRRRIQIACFSDSIYMRRGNYLKVSKRTSAKQKNTKEWRKKWKMMKNTTSVVLFSISTPQEALQSELLRALWARTLEWAQFAWDLCGLTGLASAGSFWNCNEAKPKKTPTKNICKHLWTFWAFVLWWPCGLCF